MVGDMLREADRRGDPAMLFCTDSAGFLYDSMPAITKAVGHRHPSLAGFDPGLLYRMVSCFRKASVDILHAHNLVAQLYAALAAKVLRIPCVATVHGQGVTYGRRGNRLKRVLGRLTDTTVAVSNDAAGVLLAQHAVNRSRLSVIANGVSPTVASALLDISAGGRSAARCRLGVRGDAIVIGSVGRFSVEKNYPMLVEAVAELCVGLEGGDTTRPLQLVLIGEGPDEYRIRESISAAGFEDGVLLPGRSDEVSEWLKAMDIFCLSSDTEGMSLSLLEACWAGLPAVVTDVGGNAEVVVPGQTGTVIGARDRAAMVDALRPLVLDEVLRKAMGMRARQNAKERFSFERTYNEYVKLYQALCGAQ